MVSKFVIKLGLILSAALGLTVSAYFLLYHSEVIGISPAWDMSAFQTWYHTGSIKIRTLLSD